MFFFSNFAIHTKIFLLFFLLVKKYLFLFSKSIFIIRIQAHSELGTNLISYIKVAYINISILNFLLQNLVK